MVSSKTAAFFLAASGSKGARGSAPICARVSAAGFASSTHIAGGIFFCPPENWSLRAKPQPCVGWDAPKASGRR